MRVGLSSGFVVEREKKKGKVNLVRRALELISQLFHGFYMLRPVLDNIKYVRGLPLTSSSRRAVSVGLK